MVVRTLGSRCSSCGRDLSDEPSPFIDDLPLVEWDALWGVPIVARAVLFTIANVVVIVLFSPVLIVRNGVRWLRRRPRADQAP